MRFKIVAIDECKSVSGQTDMLFLRALDCLKESEILFANNDDEKEKLMESFIKRECSSFRKLKIECVNY